MNSISYMGTSEHASDRAMDRAQWRLIPFILIMYIASFLDRANIGFAKNVLSIDIGLSEAAFALGAGIFFISYAVFEVPSNIILHYVGARRWMARILVSWGLIAAGFAFVQTETQFIILRVLLGAAEAGFFPGMVYFLSMWFTARRRSTIMGIFYFGAPLSFVFGSPLSGALLDLNGVLGFTGWQWMFAVEGLFAVVVGGIAFFYLTDRPKDASWLPEADRLALQAEIDAEQAATVTSERGSILKALSDGRVLLMCLVYFLICINTYGISFYLPSQVAKLMGRQTVGFYVGLVAAVPWICAVLANATFPRYSDRSGHKGTLTALLLGIGALGVMASSVGNPFIAFAALCVAAGGVFSCQPIFWSMPARFMHGVGLATAVGLINSVGSLGGFVAPSLRVWAEKLSGVPAAGLYALGGAGLIGTLLTLHAISKGIGVKVAPQRSSGAESDETVMMVVEK